MSSSQDSMLVQSYLSAVSIRSYPIYTWASGICSASSRPLPSSLGCGAMQCESLIGEAHPQLEMGRKQMFYFVNIKAQISPMLSWTQYDHQDSRFSASRCLRPITCKYQHVILKVRTQDMPAGTVYTVCSPNSLSISPLCLFPLVQFNSRLMF